jgi:predicted transposase YdaD
LLILTILEGDTAITKAKNLMTRARRIEAGNAIMEMISTILIYKFTTLSRDEVNAMLGYTIDELKQTRVYQEAKEEGEQRGAQREAVTLILAQLTHKFGTLSASATTQMEQLHLEKLEILSVALMGFQSLGDLDRWLLRNQS